jgi:phage terminase large subunit
MRWLDRYADDSRVWTHENRPDYGKEYARRAKLLGILRTDPKARVTTLAHYRNSPVDFILDWITTYDPRNASRGMPTTMPFCMFPRQIDYVQFLHECVQDEQGGLVEKCRDMGASYVTLAYAVWAWLFMPGTAIGVGSRKEILVDRIGDPDSLLQKVRDMIDMLPRDLFWPKGFKPKDHMPSMKIVNPANGAIISGEAGDNIGRGGRKMIFITDESAHYERPELIEAALADNTNVRIDISSVNGPGNVFHRRRMAGEVWEPGKRMTPGKTRVFIMDWRDHPAKDQAWYDARRQRAEDEGLLHKFAQEVDRDYNSAVEGVLIPSAWVQAAINAHERLDYWEPSGMWVAGQDVADSGGDVNALVIAQGSIVRYTEKDGREVDQAIPHLMLTATLWGVKVYQYEVTGVGTAPKVAARQYTQFEAIPWSPSGGVVNPNADDIAGTQVGEPDRMCNRDYFANANAQAAWNLRLRFQRTYKAVVMGERQSPDDMISIPPEDYELIQELSQPTYTSTPKITINKKPNGAKSPNKFDALKICFAPRQRRVVALEYGVETSGAVPVMAGAPELVF